MAGIGAMSGSRRRDRSPDGLHTSKHRADASTNDGDAMASGGATKRAKPGRDRRVRIGAHAAPRADVDG